MLRIFSRDFLWQFFLLFFLPVLVCATSGEVQFSIDTQYQIGTAGSYYNNGNTIAKVFDGSLLTWWDANQSYANGSNVGLDLTVPAEITRLRVAPRTGYVARLFGAILQGATVSSTTGPWTNVYTVPNFPPFNDQRQYNEISIDTLGQYYRYYRLLMPNGTYGSLAEMRLIGIASSTSPYTPVPPVVSPQGGKYALPIKVRLSSLTTDATLYYTTDGTSPSVSGGTPQGTTLLYSEPFIISDSGTTTVKAIAVSNGNLISEVSEPAYFFINTNFTPGLDWYDTSSRLIESHDGGINYFNGKYYWYGQIFNANDPENEAVGISAYSSADLINWKDEGPIIYMGRSYLLERPHVIYNDSTGKYVMWGHNVLHTPNSRAVVAYSDTPIGPFTVATTTLNPDGMGINDLGLFKDNDGSAYLLYSNGDNTKFVISRLSSDYLTTSGTYVTPATLVGREAPAMFIRNGTYYLLTSGLTGWAPNANKYSTSTSPMGTWSQQVTTFQNSAEEDVSTSYRSQTTYVLPLPDRTDSFIYLGDRFDNSNIQDGSLYNSRHIWLPIIFDSNGNFTIFWQNSWNIDNVFPSINPPSSPTGLKAIGNSNSVTLSWTNNNASDYDMYVDRADDEQFVSGVVSDKIDSGDTSYIDSSLESGHTYYYRIRIVNGSGTGNSETIYFVARQQDNNESVAVSTVTVNSRIMGNGPVVSFPVRNNSQGVTDPAKQITIHNLNSGQVSAILDLLISFNTDNKTIENVRKYLSPFPLVVPSLKAGSNSTVVPGHYFKRSLSLGSVGNDVKQLQIFLNSIGLLVASSGLGSSGNETVYFGELTKRALIKFQEYYKDDILIPAGLTKGTGYFGLMTIRKINSLLSAQ